MELLNNNLYLEDLRYIAGLRLNWEQLHGKTILISGGSGMIGSFLTDVLLYQSQKSGLGCRVCVLGRNQRKAEERFQAYCGLDCFRFINCNVSQKIPDLDFSVDYILHLASNAHPLAYASDPIGTIDANVTGTRHLLELAVRKGSRRFLFASSVEIYGEAREPAQRFTESSCGNINCNTLRAGYPESKRCGEALCQAYIHQMGTDAVIARLPKTFGPTMRSEDTKAITQFIRCAVKWQNIVLKSNGSQFYSYLYAADVAAGLLFCLLNGKCGEAYNVADQRCDVTLKDLAEIAARCAGTEVVFDLPDDTERIGYTPVVRAVMDGGKLQKLGWSAAYDLKSGIVRTVDILRNIGHVQKQ